MPLGEGENNLKSAHGSPTVQFYERFVQQKQDSVHRPVTGWSREAGFSICVHGYSFGDWHFPRPHHCSRLLAFKEESQEATARKGHPRRLPCLGALCSQSMHEVTASPVASQTLRSPRAPDLFSLKRDPQLVKEERIHVGILSRASTERGPEAVSGVGICPQQYGEIRPGRSLETGHHFP